MVSHPGSSTASTEARPVTQASFSESILSRASTNLDRPDTASTSAEGDALGITTISSSESAAAEPAKEETQVQSNGGFQTEKLVASSPRKSVSENASGDATPIASSQVEEATVEKDAKDKEDAVKQKPEVDTKAENNKAGNPIKLKSKLLAAVRDPTSLSCVLVAESAGCVRRVNVDVC